MDWTPTISELKGPLYQRIVEAMEADIAAGRLVRGQQLPTHRALAKALGIDLTTVTRAYTEARRRGIMEARVGQGSFVSETSARRAVESAASGRDRSLDERAAASARGAARRAHHCRDGSHPRAIGPNGAFLNYLPPGGSAHEREIAARWMRARVPHAQPTGS